MMVERLTMLAEYFLACIIFPLCSQFNLFLQLSTNKALYVALQLCATTTETAMEATSVTELAIVVRFDLSPGSLFFAESW